MLKQSVDSVLRGSGSCLAFSLQRIRGSASIFYVVISTEKKVGYCGILCSDCPVLIATQKNDDAERQSVAGIFTKQYGREYKKEDINCDGCTSDSLRIFSYCNMCGIRKCGMEKRVKNCGFCGEYPCEKLSKLFAEYSKAKETLEGIRHKSGIT